MRRVTPDRCGVTLCGSGVTLFGPGVNKIRPPVTLGVTVRVTLAAYAVGECR
jgi:hypothetical protein